MCITAASAHLTSTKILSFQKENGEVFLAYQNEVMNESGKNAMILPIPGKIKTLYDTSKYNTFLDTITLRTKISEEYNYGVLSGRGGMTRGMSKSLSIEQKKVGMYNIVYSALMTDLEEVCKLEDVKITPELLSFFNTHYKNFGFICCLFSSKYKMSAQPIAFDYEPINKEHIFFPTMDSHDGSAPKHTSVRLDHKISTLMNEGKLIEGEKDYPDFLKNKMFGTYDLHFSDDNGDLYFNLNQKKAPNLKRQFKVIK